MSQPTSGQWQPHPGGGQPGSQPPQWNPAPWQPPVPASRKRGPWKWIAWVAVFVAVIAVTAVVAVSLDRRGGRGDTPAAKPAAPSNMASANDTGPIGVITEDPSCAAWRPVATTLSNVENNGWAKRDPSVPASSWTADVRAQYENAGGAMRSAADQTVPLIKLTTHRVVRELYEQFIAYARAYVDRIPNYTPADNDLAVASSTASDVLTGVCESISNGSAAARAPLVAAVAVSDHVAPVGDPSSPLRFLPTPDSQCASCKQSVDSMKVDPVLAAWSTEDPAIPASAWSPEYRAQNDAVKPVLSGFSEVFERLSRAASNPVLGDFGALAAQYGRAFVSGIATYSSADLYLFNVFQKSAGLITSACRAAVSQ